MSRQIVEETRKAADLFRNLLVGKSLSRENPVYERALVFIKAAGLYSLTSDEKTAVTRAFQDCFKVTDSELLGILSGITVGDLQALPVLSNRSEMLRLEAELWSLLPKGGFLEQYATYTLNSEAPLAYHVFCAFMAIGTVVGRKVWFNMGYYKLFPTLGVFLLGPSGLRKTAAANIMLRIVQAVELTKVYPEKFTPEAIALSVAENGQGLLYAPEMSASLGKQKYLEGLIPLLTRLQDCPDEYVTDTVGRGKVLLKDVAISILMCSTPDWFVSNTPADTFGGGFIARNIMVMQTDTPREEDIPRPPKLELREDIVVRLMELSKSLSGEMQMDAQCRAFHKEWYHEHKERTKNPEHPLLATYYQRKPDHIKRVAMCLHLAERYDLLLSLESFEHARAIMEWIEQFIPPMLQSMFKTSMGETHDYVLQALKHGGGLMKHSDLVRKVQHKMDAQKLRSCLASLKEANMVAEVKNNLQHVYFIRGEEK